jgi:hypothetical protein
MAALFIGLWIAGGIPAGILGEVVQAESVRTRKAGRIAFAFLLWIDLLIAALVLAVGADAPTSPMSRSLWWFTIIVGGIPLALVSGLAVRRGYAGWHRLALAAAVFTTAALYVVFPFAFSPYGQPLTGLGRWVHEHHLLGLAILFIPTLILLVNELLWNEEATPGPEPGPTLRSRIGAIPRRYIVGTGVLALLLVWLAGTNSSGMLVGLGVVFVGTALFLWYRDRAILRGVRRDLGPPEKP